MKKKTEKIWKVQVTDGKGGWEVMKVFPAGTSFADADMWLCEFIRSNNGWASDYRLSSK